ncbi:MAG: mannonate dehydratase [Sphaerochaeta sp.]|jgi:mannonate dehydratase
MKVLACHLRDFDADTLIFLRQLGIKHVQFNTPTLPGEKTWSYSVLRNFKEKVESYGVDLVCIENVPIKFYDKVMLGLPGRDEQIDNYIKIIRNLGKLGISLFGYHFVPTFVWRTSFNAKTNNGARVSEFVLQDANTSENKIIYPARTDIEIPDEQTMWDNHLYFLEAILPEAKKSNVFLSLHPDDPPIPMVANVHRLFYKFENFKRFNDLINHPNWGLDLCLGCCSEMNGSESVHQFIEYFGPLGKIFYVHFRDVVGVIPDFKECFLGEGNFNPSKVLRHLRQVGFDGYITVDHTPIVQGDTQWGHRSRAFEMGKLQGMLDMMTYDDENTTLISK